MKSNLNKYLDAKFPGLKICNPLFYSWDIGIRFALSSNETSVFLDNDEDEYNEVYFEELIKRATRLFESIFDPGDEMLLVYQMFAWKRQKLKKNNYCFKQISQLTNSNIEYKTLKNLYEPKNCYDVWKRAIINTETNRVNYKNIFEAVSNYDFINRIPRVLGEVFFVNTTRDVILHMYDDRGLDVIASIKRVYMMFMKNIMNGF